MNADKRLNSYCKVCGTPCFAQFGTCSSACRMIQQRGGERAPQRARRPKGETFPRVAYQDRDQFLKQHMGEECCICGDLPVKKRHALDHCHLTGRIRGVLCVRCNTGLGMFKDDIRILELAIAYLKRVDHFHDSRPPSRLAKTFKS